MGANMHLNQISTHTHTHRQPHINTPSPMHVLQPKNACTKARVILTHTLSHTHLQYLDLFTVILSSIEITEKVLHRTDKTDKLKVELCELYIFFPLSVLTFLHAKDG